jgi:hypothetical protein
MFRFGWVRVSAEVPRIRQRFPEATFALYEVRGSDGANEYRLGSVDLKRPASDAAP